MKSRRTAVLWFLGGAALLAAGWIAEPRRPLSLLAGFLFLVLGATSLARGRSP